MSDARVYLAAPYRYRAEASQVAALLSGHGVEVVSTWHDRPEPANAPEGRWENAHITRQNVADQRKATRLVVLAWEGGQETWVELGRWLGLDEGAGRDSTPLVVDLCGAALRSTSARGICTVEVPASRSLDAVAEVVARALAEVL